MLPVQAGAEKASPAIFAVLELAGRVGLDRRPGLVLIGLGALVFAAVMASKLVRLFGVGLGNLEPIEFVASLAAAGFVVLIGAALHMSADRLQGHGTKAAVDAALGYARLLRRPGVADRDLGA